MQPLPPPPPAGASKDSLRRHYRQLRRQSLPLAEAALLEVLATALPQALAAADAKASARANPQAASSPPAAASPSKGSAPPKAAPSRLGLYWPVGHEPDWRPLLERWPEALRQRLALPVVRSVGGVGRLTYGAWHPADPLRADGCGIPAPVAAAPLEAHALALLLVPALAIDQRGIRLGSGGGWYDRLRADPAWRQLPALAVLPAACLAPSLPADPWDVPFTGWLDETGGSTKVSGFD
jgi:5-formyltetrahydrofolate cyclo-ligase